MYLLLNLGTLAIPLAFSFGPKIQFYRSFRFLFVSILITSSVFIGWDYIFTTIGIWEFNVEYTMGIMLLNMPVEEWMFFFCIPYACVFTHEALKYYIPSTPLGKHGQLIARIISVILILTVMFFHDRLYTTVTFTLLALVLVSSLYLFRATYLGRFFFSYLITLIPFIVVNGILTSMPVLIYDNAENMGIRIGTIPLEDFFYWMLLYLFNIIIFEETRKKYKDKKSPSPRL